LANHFLFHQGQDQKDQADYKFLHYILILYVPLTGQATLQPLASMMRVGLAVSLALAPMPTQQGSLCGGMMRGIRRAGLVWKTHVPMLP
tara:strand:- start:153 stop:419 length:267 start_codon:yes stop_codon:yes gene_type:complete